MNMEKKKEKKKKRKVPYENLKEEWVILTQAQTSIYEDLMDPLKSLDLSMAHWFGLRPIQESFCCKLKTKPRNLFLQKTRRLRRHVGGRNLSLFPILRIPETH